MAELLLLAAALFFGIMFGVFIVSSASEIAGVWGLILLVAVIAIGFAIARSSNSGGEKK
jgi:hypothetical protein